MGNGIFYVGIMLYLLPALSAITCFYLCNRLIIRVSQVQVLVGPLVIVFVAMNCGNDRARKIHNSTESTRKAPGITQEVSYAAAS